MMLFAAQASLNQKALWPAMLYLAGIVVAVGLALAIFAAIRRWSRADPLEESSGGLTLGQARQWRALGVLTEQEFDQIKRVIIGSALVSEENRTATVQRSGSSAP